MKRSALALFLLLPLVVFAQHNDEATDRTEKYFDHIRSTESELTTFFQAMPKGGDLHNHFTGAIFPEEYYDIARDSGFYVNLNTFSLYAPQTNSYDPGVVKIKTYTGPVDIRTNLIENWSIRNYTSSEGAPDDFFFSTFGKFGALVPGNETKYLMNLKKRYISENIQYLETMFLRATYDHTNKALVGYLSSKDADLEKIQAVHDKAALYKVLDEIYSELTTKYSFTDVANSFSQNVKSLYAKSALPNGADSALELRFLNYCSRTLPPSDVFGQLVLSFLSCDNELIVGVNIVAPENNPTSMQDYWLHTMYFAYLHEKFPQVKYSMHAGELTMNQVKPEDLHWHIRQAVLEAGANRIGHGVDLPFERDCLALLDTMAARKTAIEINLTSNEFILGVKDGFHPFPLYFSHHVPIVISTDDAGILRTNHTDQFVLLAKRYSEVKYKDIKQFVYNSIDYSFMPDAKKKTLHTKLDQKFTAFEKQF